MNCIQRYKIQWVVIAIGHSIRSDNNVSFESSLLLPLPMFAFFVIISHHIVNTISCLRQYALNGLFSALLVVFYTIFWSRSVVLVSIFYFILFFTDCQDTRPDCSNFANQCSDSAVSAACPQTCNLCPSGKNMILKFGYFSFCLNCRSHRSFESF